MDAMTSKARPRRKGDDQFMILIVVIGLLTCVCFPAQVAYTMWADPKAAAGMTAAATRYLDALRDGDPAKAYQWICRSQQKQYPLSRWLSIYTFPDIASYQITGTKITRRRTTRYIVETEIHYADGQVRPWSINMSDEKAGWRVCIRRAIGSNN
jgi:hypothetical protein